VNTYSTDEIDDRLKHILILKAERESKF